MFRSERKRKLKLAHALLNLTSPAAGADRTEGSVRLPRSGLAAHPEPVLAALLDRTLRGAHVRSSGESGERRGRGREDAGRGGRAREDVGVGRGREDVGRGGEGGRRERGRGTAGGVIDGGGYYGPPL